jgi:hypothetical protein
LQRRHAVNVHGAGLPVGRVFSQQRLDRLRFWCYNTHTLTD